MNQSHKTIVLAVLLATLAPCGTAAAHHILGVPHYAYDDEYPQTPVLTYSVEAGPYHIQMTGNPGNPDPGEACSLHVYVSRIDNGAPFTGIVTLTVMRDIMIGTDPVIYGPIEAEIEEAMFKFHPVFKDEANYIVRIAYQAEGAPWIIDLPMVAGEPGSPWAVVATVAVSVALFLIVVRAIRVKMRRREKLAAKTINPVPSQNPIPSQNAVQPGP